jgi:hypothetical protein
VSPSARPVPIPALRLKGVIREDGWVAGCPVGSGCGVRIHERMGRSVRRLPAGLHGCWRGLHEYVSVERSTGYARDAHHRCNAASYLDVEWKCLGVGYSDAKLAVISMMLFIYLRRVLVRRGNG